MLACFESRTQCKSAEITEFSPWPMAMPDLHNLPEESLGQVPKIFLRSAKDDEKRRKLMKNAENFSSPHVFLGIS